MIEITEEQIQRVNLILSGIPKGAEKAFTNSINRGLANVRTNSAKLITQTYNIKQKDLKSRSNIKVKKANFSDLEGSITFAGSVIPLIKFKVSPTEPSQKPVTVSVLKEQGGQRLKSAYVANLGKYETGVFERLTRKRESSQQLYGPSSAHMAANEEVLEKTSGQAQNIIDNRIEHEISRILNGYV